MTNSRQKGKAGEREWRDVLRAAGWMAAERGVQHQGGKDSPDVKNGPAMTHAEVKYSAGLNIYDALEQSESEAGPGELPYVAFRRVRRGSGNRGWVVVLRDVDFFELCRLREEKIHDTLRGSVEGPPVASVDGAFQDGAGSPECGC